MYFSYFHLGRENITVFYVSIINKTTAKKKNRF